MRDFLSNIYLYLKILFGFTYRDTQCGFKLFSKSAVEKIFKKLRIKKWGFDIEILALAKYLCLDVKEVAINWKDSKDSKLNPLKASMQVLAESLKIKYYFITNKYINSSNHENR